MVVVAIDTGGTKIAGAAIDQNGKILHKFRYPNDGRSGPFIIDTYTRIVEEMRSKFDISAIGIGAGGRIDPQDGTVLFAVDIYSDYIGLPIGKVMTERCGLPVFVDNDCRVAVYGERWMGSARGFDNVFGVILGTGVGGGYMVDGKPVYGAAGSAGEVGHMILHPGGHDCGCGQKGCVEKYLSGTALWRIYNCVAGSDLLRSGYSFFEKLHAGDEISRKVLDWFVQDLALCTVSLSNLLSPQAILFGGGVMDTADLWWESFINICHDLGSIHLNNTALLRAATGNDAALLGAAWLAFERL